MRLSAWSSFERSVYGEICAGLLLVVILAALYIAGAVQ